MPDTSGRQIHAAYEKRSGIVADNLPKDGEDIGRRHAGNLVEFDFVPACPGVVAVHRNREASRP